jgi:hypothetical protein
MRSHRLSLLVLALVFLVAAIAVAQTASASPPSDLGPLGPPPNVPNCTPGAPDTKGAHICWVTPLRPGWQASTGEWIVIRVGDASDVDPANPGAAQARCEQLQASVVATITLDGQSLPVDTIPCEFQPQAGRWFVDFRALTHPLPPGEHTFSESWFFTTTVPGVANAGETWTFPTQKVTVVPQG